MKTAVTTRVRWAACVAIAVVALSIVMPARSASAETDTAPVQRVLVLSLPGLSWEDLDLSTLPHLRSLFEESTLADMSVRGVTRTPTLGDAYVTIGAGARAVSRDDGGECFQASERVESGTAREAFERRLGSDAPSVSSTSIVCLAQRAIASRNDGLLYDAQTGLLGDTLAAHGVSRAVIGNADEAEPPPNEDWSRSAALTLADADGVVPGGAVSDRLLVRDSRFPFGVRSNDDKVLAAFEEAWSQRTVVVVEASDLARYEQYRPVVASAARQGLHQAVLERVDSLVGSLLEHVDPAHDAVLVVAPSQRNARGRPLTVAALKAPGFEPGLMSSAYTRHSGIVSIIDVGPTILDQLGIKLPDNMEGRAFEFSERGGNFAARLSSLEATNQEAQFRDRLVAPVSFAFVIMQIALILAAIAVVLWLGRRARAAVQVAALALLGFLPATYLAGLFPFYRWPTATYWLFLLGTGVVIGLGAWLLTARRGVTTLIVALGVVVGLIIVDVATGSRLQFNTVFGYSPTVAGRFAGLGNLGYSQLAAGAVLLAGLIAFRVPGRLGVRLAIALLVVAIVVDGAPFFGSDVGGVLSMVPAYLVTSTLLLGWRFRWRLLAIYGGVTALVIGLFGVYDVSRPTNDQTHLGRLISSGSGNGGMQRVSIVIERKLDANTSVLFRSVWTIMVPVVLVGIFYLVSHSPGKLRGLCERIPPLSASLVGFAIVAVLGFALNDSGIAVPAMMLGVLSPVLIVLTLRAGGDPDHDIELDDELAELSRRAGSHA